MKRLLSLLLIAVLLAVAISKEPFMCLGVLFTAAFLGIMVLGCYVLVVLCRKIKNENISATILVVSALSLALGYIYAMDKASPYIKEFINNVIN